MATTQPAIENNPPTAVIVDGVIVAMTTHSNLTYDVAE